MFFQALVLVVSVLNSVHSFGMDIEKNTQDFKASSQSGSGNTVQLNPVLEAKEETNPKVKVEKSRGEVSLIKAGKLAIWS